jgi:hypothetical protein
VADRPDSDREVLTSLPRSRPVRRSSKRGDRPDAKNGAGAASAPKSAPRTRTAPRRKVPPAGYAVPTARAEDSSGSGTADLLGTTIQAVAELTQIGLTVGRQTVQSMIDRLPKP